MLVGKGDTVLVGVGVKLVVIVGVRVKEGVTLTDVLIVGVIVGVTKEGLPNAIIIQFSLGSHFKSCRISFCVTIRWC